MGMDLIPVYEDAPAEDTAVLISPAVENNLGVKVADVEKSILNNDIATVGYVRFDEDRLHHVHVRVEGWIETLSIASSGEQVSAGQVLFELYSPALFNAQKDLVSVLGGGNQRLIESAQQRLRLQGMAPRQIEQVVKTGRALEKIAVYAKHSGIVSELNVRHGMFIEPSVEVMAIGSINSVWVIAEIFEREAAWIQPGQLVTITTSSYPAEQWQARVDYIYPVLNAQARTLQVRIRVDNPDQRLKPNMFTDLLIHAAGEEAVLNIPRSALIRGGHGDRVVMALGQGRYRSVPVRAGRGAGDRVEIVTGLVLGDQVVTSGQFLIDSESNISAENERLDAGTASGVSQ
jgi:Cu(I)/Ag(I) efflux system membrane fusion protein